MILKSEESPSTISKRRKKKRKKNAANFSGSNYIHNFKTNDLVRPEWNITDKTGLYFPLINWIFQENRID